jgi:hypothetical protein
MRNGMLVSLGEPRGHLITDSSYRDYRLEIEYRFPAAPGNAGILVHASTPRALYSMFPRSIEVQMEHGNAGDFWCILEDIWVPDMEKRRGTPWEWGTTEGKARRILNLTDSSEKPLGQWNTMVIEAVGTSIKVWVNGDLVNAGSEATADHGQIAVQSEGSEVEFRKLSLTPIARPLYIGGWPESQRAELERVARGMNDNIGAIPDTLTRTPSHIQIVFNNPPFAPIWGTDAPNGGLICHDLKGSMKDLVKPIARYIYAKTPDRNVDTVSVIIHTAIRLGGFGRCSSGARIGFTAAELAPGPGLVPVPPTRDPHTPGYVAAKELSDGVVPPTNEDGNFIIGPKHPPARETLANDSVPRGTIHTFTMRSADSKIFPGIARDSGTFGTVSPTDPATLIVTTSHPAPYMRTVAVYVPAQYVPGTAAPFIVGADGPDPMLFTTLDNLIAEKRVPVMLAISIGNGGGDAQGSERALEYDTMSPTYANFVETEVLPLVERQFNVKLTKDPNGRATMGGSSGGSAAFIMAWYRPDLYRRVLAYSITAINQQWPHNPETPHGAWGFHESLIPNSPVKPIRVWLEVGDKDFLNPNVMRDGMHDWVIASENMAKVLAAKGYHYQFVFARNAVHVDRAVKAQTLPGALEWLWKGYR